jgi:hypothetical protein
MKIENKHLHVGKPTILTKEPKHTLWSPVSVESDSTSSENSDSEMASMWADNKIPSIKEEYKQNPSYISQPCHDMPF